MRVIKGDLVKFALNNYFDIIIHGCNCFCVMGAGVAKKIKDTFPGAYKADCRTKAGDRSKLGTFSFADCETKTGMPLIVMNAYTQYRYGRDRPHVNYDAIESVMVILGMNYPDDTRIGMPKIGCGLAGGEWEIVESIIQKTLSSHDVTIVEYPNREF